MKLGPRGKLVLVMAIFAAPVIASYLAYFFAHPRPTAQHGELLLPPGERARGRWVLVAMDSAACDKPCQEKLIAMRQVRLALGRNASRVERVFVVEDGRATDPKEMAAFPGMDVVVAPAGAALSPKARGDDAHVYLVDPNGNVMMRWRAADDPKGMLKDLERLLRASQIG